MADLLFIQTKQSAQAKQAHFEMWEAEKRGRKKFQPVPVGIG